MDGLFFHSHSSTMPVPKKRLSKAKTRLRKTLWKEEARAKAEKALSLALSHLKNRLLERPSEEK